MSVIKDAYSSFCLSVSKCKEKIIGRVFKEGMFFSQDLIHILLKTRHILLVAFVQGEREFNKLFCRLAFCRIDSVNFYFLMHCTLLKYLSFNRDYTLSAFL
ncbi:MAG: hypothetical protein DRP57_13725 [Spirochaetes bacterium]|nr:MAG: hypothetical protein DRP57_13725 [Spirochaetota bacterium]